MTEQAGQDIVEWGYENMDKLRAGDVEECVNVIVDEEANQNRAWNHLEVSQVPDDLVDALREEVNA